MMKQLLFLAMVMMSVVSCTTDKSDMVIPVPPINDTVIISYKNDMVPILITYCYGEGFPTDDNKQLCHVSNTNQGSSGDFTKYQELKDRVDNGAIESRVFSSNGGMPPSYSETPVELTDSDFQKFELWIAQGALDN